MFWIEFCGEHSPDPTVSVPASFQQHPEYAPQCPLAQASPLQSVAHGMNAFATPPVSVKIIDVDKIKNLTLFIMILYLAVVCLLSTRKIAC
jgi:hypothetical protein